MWCSKTLKIFKNANLERIATVAITTALLGKDEAVEVSTHLGEWSQSDGWRPSIASDS